MGKLFTNSALIGLASSFLLSALTYPLRTVPTLTSLTPFIASLFGIILLGFYLANVSNFVRTYSIRVAVFFAATAIFTVCFYFFVLATDGILSWGDGGFYLILIIAIVLGALLYLLPLFSLGTTRRQLILFIACFPPLIWVMIFTTDLATHTVLSILAPSKPSLFTYLIHHSIDIFIPQMEVLVYVWLWNRKALKKTAILE